MEYLHTMVRISDVDRSLEDAFLAVAGRSFSDAEAAAWSAP